MSGRFAVADLRASYSDQKKRRDSKYLWVLLLRQPSFYAARLFLELGVTANQITWLSLALGLTGCSFVAVGHGAFMVGGVLLVNLWFFLDCVDGNVARHSRSSGDYGRFIDDLGGYVMMAGLFTSVGLGLYRHPEGILGPELDPGVYLLAGALGSLAAALNKQISFKFQLLFGSAKRAGAADAPDRSESPLRLLWRNLMGFSGLILPLFTLACLLAGRDLFVLFYAALHLANSVASVRRCVSRASRRAAAA